MADAEEYPREFWLIQNPHHPFGRRLWDLSRPAGAKAVSLVVAVAGLVGGIILATELGGAVALPVAVSGFAWFFVWATVSEMADDVLCSGCGYRQRAYNHYCPACGAEVDTDA